jgi:hypothetical protein
LSTENNTCHIKLNAVFTGFFEWMNYMYTLWLWPKKFRPFQKPTYMQRGILLPLRCCLVVDEVRENSMGMAVLHWGMLYSL